MTLHCIFDMRLLVGGFRNFVVRGSVEHEQLVRESTHAILNRPCSQITDVVVLREELAKISIFHKRQMKVTDWTRRFVVYVDWETDLIIQGSQELVVDDSGFVTAEGEERQEAVNTTGHSRLG